MLKGFDKDGFVWLVLIIFVVVHSKRLSEDTTLFFRSYIESSLCRYTNYEGSKGQQIAENPHAALLFYWDDLNRQVYRYPELSYL